MPDVWAATWEFSGAFGAWTKILPGCLLRPWERSQIGSDFSGPACKPWASPTVRIVALVPPWKKQDNAESDSSQESSDWESTDPLQESSDKAPSGDRDFPLGVPTWEQESKKKTLLRTWTRNRSNIMFSPTGNSQGNCGVRLQYQNYSMSTSDLQKTRRTCGIGLRSEWLPRIRGRCSAFVVPLCMS